MTDEIKKLRDEMADLWDEEGMKKDDEWYGDTFSYKAGFSAAYDLQQKRTCVNCKNYFGEKEYAYVPFDRCSFLCLNLNNGINPESFSCAAFTPLSEGEV